MFWFILCLCSMKRVTWCVKLPRYLTSAMKISEQSLIQCIRIEQLPCSRSALILALPISCGGWHTQLILSHFELHIVATFPLKIVMFVKVLNQDLNLFLGEGKFCWHLWILLDIGSCHWFLCCACQFQYLFSLSFYHTKVLTVLD